MVRTHGIGGTRTTTDMEDYGVDSTSEMIISAQSGTRLCHTSVSLALLQFNEN